MTVVCKQCCIIKCGRGTSRLIQEEWAWCVVVETRDCQNRVMLFLKGRDRELWSFRKEERVLSSSEHRAVEVCSQLQTSRLRQGLVATTEYKQEVQATWLRARRKGSADRASQPLRQAGAVQKRIGTDVES